MSRLRVIKYRKAVVIITPKQMRFCQEYFKTGNGTQAYLTAYNSNSPTSAQIEASRLLDREDVQEYLKELRRPVEKAVKRKIINEREYKKKLIQERIDECVARGDDAAIARYIEIWNKMDGEYVNINKDFTDRETEIKNLDNDTLLKLAQSEMGGVPDLELAK